jgi:hypothetical protein
MHFHWRAKRPPRGLGKVVLILSFRLPVLTHQNGLVYFRR